jgi:hypothetical protein
MVVETSGVVVTGVKTVTSLVNSDVNTKDKVEMVEMTVVVKVSVVVVEVVVETIVVEVLIVVYW